MAESTQPENETKKVNLSDILDSKRNKQMLPDELNDIQFRPLAMKAEKHQAKIDKLNIRAAKLTDKINKSKQKIAKWNAKIADAQNTKAYCKQLLETQSLPNPLQIFFQSMLDRQDKKIESCKEKIGQKQEKIKKFESKQTQYRTKITKRQAKIDKIAVIDRFITNMASEQGRRENFLQMLTGLRNSSLDKKNKKVLSLENKIAQKELALSKASTETEKVRLKQQIDKLNEQKDKLQEKIKQLETMTEKLEAFAAMPEYDTDKVIDAATENAKATFEHDDYDNMEDVIIDEADKAFSDQNKKQAMKPEPDENKVSEPEQDEPDKPDELEMPEPEPQANQNQSKYTEQTQNSQKKQKSTHDTQKTSANKQSELVKYTGLSGMHVQALEESKIPFWVKKETEDTFSAFVQRPNAEKAKSILSSLSQAQNKTFSQLRQPHRKM